MGVNVRYLGKLFQGGGGRVFAWGVQGGKKRPSGGVADGLGCGVFVCVGDGVLF